MAYNVPNVPSAIVRPSENSAKTNADKKIQEAASRAIKEASNKRGPSTSGKR